uniref:Elongation of very long chain fatty acids protein n=1 Tax=Glossina morsitans morsitans TaxID=37546 RepID=A0A1B0G676_GLOMM
MECGFSQLIALLSKSKDSRIDGWFLMSSPVNVTLIILAYIFIVLRIGPSLMKNRKAYSLRHTLAVYNLFQIIYNSYLFWSLGSEAQPIGSLMKDDCKIERSDELTLQCFGFGWWYLMNKIVDFMDTIFMILRKKNHQITFLHVYHHAIMVVLSWVSMKYIGVREEFGIVTALNAGVHVLMYFYYFVAAVGPQSQMYLQWKIYITKIQIGQFFVGPLYLLATVVRGCQVPRVYMFWTVVNAAVFILLFTNFYLKTYTNRQVMNMKEVRSENIKKST